jgi:hypothetical protein
MALFAIPGIGHAEALGLQHLPAWNAIARDPVVRDKLGLPELEEYFVAGLGGVFASFADDVRTGSATRYELVVVDRLGDVVAAVQLSCYICSDDDEADGGVAVDIAVPANLRGQGIAPSTLRSLATWVVSLVPSAHVHADVCTKNDASAIAVSKAGWKSVDSDVDCHIHHDCDMKAVRNCAHQSH